MLHLEIITPQSVAWQGEVDAVALPTGDGEIVVLPHHVPLVATIVPGTVTVSIGSAEHVFAVSRGVMEVDGLHMRILTDIADPADALDEAAIEEAKRKAEVLMTEKRHDVEGFAEATAILERELARLKTVRHHRARRPTSPPAP